jgi:glycosyltransferase involved in cell wall biosynthesis
MEMNDQVCHSTSVVWLPASPVEGWTSMDRYWRELNALSASSHFDDLRFSCALRSSPPLKTIKSSRFWRSFEKYLAYPVRARFQNAQIAHILDHSYAHLIDSLPKKTRKVVTVFDLVPLEDSGTLTKAQVNRFRSTVMHLQKADHLISISEETKRKLQTLLDISEDKISVAVPGMDFPLFQKPVKKTNALRSSLSNLPPIIFSIGSTASRKNLSSLPQIFYQMRRMFANKDCCFVRAGDYLPESLKKEIISITGEHGFLELGPIFGEDLVAAYQSAKVLIFPSTLEGLTFVIPEAMASGCPVVTNTLTANPEAGGTAALYYTEGDYAKAALHLTNILTLPELHSKAKAEGIERARTMTWSHHFETLVRVYRQLGHHLKTS